MTPRRIGALFGAPIVAAMLLSACYVWQPTPPPPVPTLAQEKPKRVRLTLNDGRTLELDRPRIEGDTIVGAVLGSAKGGQPLVVARIATSDVNQAESFKFSTRRTVALTVVPPLLALLGVLLVGAE